MSRGGEYDWVTHEMFQNELEKILDGMTGGAILMVPGAWEVFAEYFNDEVLENLENNKDFD